MNYFLIGYMGSGKTRRGREMAEELGIRFIDLDTYIEERERSSIFRLFSEKGEEGFRTLESRYLREVCELFDRFVLSTGGGTPCFHGNMEYMNAQGHTIFLNTDARILAERLVHGKWRRPLINELKDEEVHPFVCRHLEERMPFYSLAREEIRESEENIEPNV
ncbi:MAG: shikimate kinase [Culturomica sp.]|jgi:shikimate kinase|nr:shikimate kinase [Culturomica sp.]